ncbi:MAG: AAA family ATPase [Acidimicrobiales bacterium]
MRPERLELEGFTAFTQRTVIDFTDADLFAFSGPTGAGKSSVIDAMIFALYGQVPRYGDARLVEPVISRGRVEARVGLDFRLGPALYRAVRVVRAKTGGGATTKEARLERLSDTGPNEVLAGDARSMTGAVEQLLGLTYEHFTTAVVLPQGQFARFLHHSPGDRQALLKELLDLGLYDRLQRRCRIHTDQCAALVRVTTDRLAELSQVTDAAVQAVEHQRERATALLEACDAARPQLQLLEGELRELAQRQSHDEQVLTQLTALRKPADVNTLSDDHDAQQRLLASLQDEIEAFEQVLQQLDDAVGRLPSADTSRALLASHQQHAELAQQCARGENAMSDAIAASDSARITEAAAAADLQKAETALADAAAADTAASLAQHLHPGDDCPVCGATIVTLAAPVGPRLQAATAARDQADQARQAAAGARQVAEIHQGRVETKLESVRQQLHDLQHELSTKPDADSARAELAETERIGNERQTVQHTHAALRRRRDTAQQQLRAGEAARHNAMTAFDKARDGVAALQPPAPGRNDLSADWDQLLQWAAAATEQCQQRLTELAEAIGVGAERRSQLIRSLTQQAGPVLSSATGASLSAGTDPGAIRDQAVALLARLDNEVEALRRDLERSARLRAELDQANSDERVGRELTRLLRSDQFVAWILDEATQQLVDAATGLLQRLSGGAYSLVLQDKDFSVLDHNNADALRSVRTLSGGETFLASLALALALAEQVVKLAGPGAAPLESLFLDEGFGTLDPDTLDTVATAIEELGSNGRMVGIITHVRELAERLPVRFEVTKSVDGAAIERVLA